MGEGHRLRVLGALVGDITSQPANRIKYGGLFAALAREVDLVAVHDAALHGWRRLLGGAVAVHPDRQRWKERFYRHPASFRVRSRQLGGVLAAQPVDVVLQLGTMFDATRAHPSRPVVVYTDYTAALGRRRPGRHREAYRGRLGREWLDLERQVLLAADGVAARSRVVAASIVDDYGVDPGAVTVVGGGVNLAALPPPRSRPPAAPTVLFVGTDFHRKGGDVLLRAFADVRRTIPDARVVVVTADRVPEHLLVEGVEVRPPVWDREELAALYRGADVFALPARLETWGDVLLEAMAHGLPCVGTAGDAMDEIIADGVTGAVVEPGDAEQLASSLVALLADEGKREAWGAAGRRRVAERFTWEAVSSRLLPLLREAAASRS